MRVRLACIVLALSVALLGSVADAGSTGRARFVKHADNLCQPQRNDAKRRIIHGVKLLKHKRVRAAGREFVRAYREMRKAYRQVSRLPAPVATTSGSRSGCTARSERPRPGSGRRSPSSTAA